MSGEPQPDSPLFWAVFFLEPCLQLSVTCFCQPQPQPGSWAALHCPGRVEVVDAFLDLAPP